MTANLPSKKYSVIYADPPWQYHPKPNWTGRPLEKHYPTMRHEEIMALPIKEIADENCVLLMWVTFPKLKEALDVVESWGFEYKTNAFTWVKKNKVSDSWFTGMGYYTRSNSEICILATKGKVLERKSHSVRQICDARIMKHSKKPPEIRDRIVELFGDVPRVELFARETAEGWDSWGNEV